MNVQKGREGLSLGLFTAEKKTNLCTVTDKSVVFHEECLFFFWTDAGSLKSCHLNKMSTNFFVQLIKAADSAHI